MTTPDLVKQWIEAGLESASARVADDGSHFESVVVLLRVSG